MQKCMIRTCAVVGLLAAGMPPPSTAETSKANNSSQVVLLKESVRENGGTIWALSRRIGELRVKMIFLPERSWFGAADKQSCQKLLVGKVSRLRAALLSTRAKVPVGDDFNISPDAASGALRNVEALGLRFPSVAELMVVDAQDLLDLAIVSFGVDYVVEHLRDLAAGTADISSAKRYIQSYVGMLAVLQSSYELYLEKNRSWRARIKVLDNIATKFHAVKAYKILVAHAVYIQAKVDKAAEILGVAENSYQRVASLDECRSLLRSNQDSFNALLRLQLPQETSNDTALQTEFAALTQQLKAEDKNQ